MRWLWAVGTVWLLAVSADARVILVGVDGGSWNVIDPMIAAGELPNLAAIAREGVTADLETVEPVSSPVVWTSIATGRTPEAHGITDFFSTGLDIRVPTVFERLSAAGMRVGLYDYLMTWPPVTLEGGFVLPGWLRRDDSVTPADAWSRIGLTPWRNAYDPLKTSEDYRVNALREVEAKAPRWNALAEAFDVEVGAVTFYAIDAMSHRFWHGAFPEEFDEATAGLATGDERSALADAVRGIDRQVGMIRDQLSESDTILIVSDHGFHAGSGARDVWVSHFDPLLERAGLDPDRDGFGVVTEFGQLVVGVSPGPNAERTTERLAALVESIRSADGGGLYWAAEVLDVAPRPPGRERPLLNRLRQWAVKTVLSVGFSVQLDPSAHAIVFALPRGGVLAELSPETKVMAGGSELPLREVFSRQLFTGDHDEIGIFLAAGGPIRPAAERGRISVLDVAPLVFHVAGKPVPDDLEGRVPEAWLDPERLREHPVRLAPASEMPGIPREARAGGISDDPDLVERLRRLGYID